MWRWRSFVSTFSILSVSCSHLIARKKLFCAPSKTLALNSAQRVFLPFFLPSRNWKEARDQEEAELPVGFNEFARRRERVRDCWRSENVREFYFSDVGRVLAVRQVGDSHQVERWTLRIRNLFLLSVFSSGEVYSIISIRQNKNKDIFRAII